MLSPPNSQAQLLPGSQDGALAGDGHAALAAHRRKRATAGAGGGGEDFLQRVFTMGYFPPNLHNNHQHPLPSGKLRASS